jgi:hypothetical protein
MITDGEIIKEGTTTDHQITATIKEVITIIHLKEADMIIMEITVATISMEESKMIV